MDIRKTRRLANINRFSLYYKIKPQSVAEHAHFVGIIVMDILNNFYKNDLSLKLKTLEAAIWHDINEASIGDLNKLTKNLMTNFEEIEEVAAKTLGFDKNPEIINDKKVEEILNFADILEMKLYLEEEFAMGNTTLIDIERESYKILLNHKFEYKDHYVNLLKPVDPKDMPEGLR